MGQTVVLPLADGGAASGFSLDDLTIALLVGSLVLVVSVAAVRLSVRSGLPSLLIYLGIGLVLGEAGFGIRYDNEQLTQVLGLRRPRPHPRRGRSHDPVVRHPPLGRPGRGARHRRGRRVGARRGRRGARAARRGRGDVVPRRRRARLDRCRGRLLRAAARAAAAADLGDARGGVGLQRRPGRAARDRDRGIGLAPGRDARPVVADRRRRGRSSWSGGAVIGLAVGWAGGAGAAAGRVDVVRAVRDRRRVGGRARVRRGRRRARLGVPRLLPRGARARQPRGCPTGRPCVGFATAIGWLAQIGLFVLLGLLASPGGFVDVLVPALVVGAALLLLGRPLSVHRVVRAVRDVVAHPGLPVVGRAARCGARRARHRAGDDRHTRRGRGSSTSCSCSSSSSPWSRRRRCPGSRGGWGWPRAHQSLDLAVETTPLDRPRRRAARDRHRAAVADRRRAGVRAAPAAGGQRRPRRARGALVRAAGQRRAAPRRPAARRRPERDAADASSAGCTR